MSSIPSHTHIFAPVHPILIPDILGEISWHADVGDLFTHALVHRQWTHPANLYLYRHVRLCGRHDVARFFQCLMHPTIVEHERLQQTSLMHTLHVQFTDTSSEALARPLNKDAYRQLEQIFPHLVNLTRVLVEVHIGFNWEEYNWLGNWLLAMPDSLRVCMIRVRVWRQLCRSSLSSCCIQLADGQGIHFSNEGRWARLIRSLQCTTLVLISNPPIFHPETCNSKLPDLLSKAMMRGERKESSRPITLRRIEIWTSVHNIFWTKGLQIERIIHHTDVPEWDNYYCHAAQWDGVKSQWEFHEDREVMQSCLPGMAAERCPGATIINPFDPTRGTCGARNSFKRWVVCDDGTLCRREDKDKPRLPSDWVKWEDNTFGRRALGMYVPLKR